MSPGSVECIYDPYESVNSAFTLQAWVIDTVHVPVPEQAPDQPVNDDPDDAVAERVTDVPCV